jgi:hypothetical protein
MVDTVIVTPAATDAGEGLTSAVSWPAILAGGFAAVALSIVLFTLGAGLGLSAVSPWSDRGISSDTAALAGGIYLVVVAVMSSAVGGYIAGRLRARWLGTHTDEIYFRDTAHGFLAWAVATVISVAFLASAATTITGGAAAGAGPGAAMAGNRGAMQDRLNGYSDELLRPNFAAAKTNDAAPTTTTTGTATTAPTGSLSVPGNDQPRVQASDRTEVYRLLAKSERGGAMAQRDHDYLVQMVAARTGLSQADAEKRVADISTDLKVSADKARKGAAHLAFWITASLLFGALAASLAATEGGGLRDGTWKYRR